MPDPQAAFSSRTFKKDKTAWAVLLLFVLAIYLGAWLWEKTDRVTLGSWQGPVSKQATFTVLEYDRVVSNKSTDHISRENFLKQLQALKEDGYQAVSLTHINNFYYENKNLPEKSVLLMFAHGYLETYVTVDPILRQLKWPAVMTINPENIVKREPFFLYWDRLQRMVGSGVWGLVSGGHLSGLNTNQPPLNKIYPLGFAKSFIGVNAKNSDPLRLRRLRVQPDWNPETLLTLMDHGIKAVNPVRENSSMDESLWFQEDGEWVDTSTHQNKRKNIRLAETQDTEHGFHLHGVPGAGLYFPADNKAQDWVLEADIRLDRGEFWIRQYSAKTGDGWRVGGNSETMNAQIRLANRKYENLAGSKAGVVSDKWHRLRLIKRGKGIIVEWNGELLWKFPVHLPGNLKGDIFLQVWAGQGEASLRVSDARISMLPEDIRWLEKFPEENDIQLLIKNAETVSAVTTVTHTLEKNRMKPVPFDEDLFQIISHRYGWEFIPTLQILPQKHLPGDTGTNIGGEEIFLVQPILYWVQENHWSLVHLDLSRWNHEQRDEMILWIKKLRNELIKIDCLLLATLEGRQDASQSLTIESPFMENNSKSKWLVAEQSR